MKSEGKGRKSILRRPPPSVVVLATASAVVLLAAFASIFGSAGSWAARMHPKVEYVDAAPVAGGKAREKGSAAGDRPLFDGEVFNTSERVGEAAALAGGAILFAAGRGAEYANAHGGNALPGLPADHKELLRAMAAENLLPLGVALGADFTLGSRTSVISVRYRPDPLSVEVVSMARDESGGPAIMLRMPDEFGGGGPAVRYYMAQRLGVQDVPPAFESVSKITRMGWLPQEFRAEPATAEQLRSAARRLEQERLALQGAMNEGVKR